jgi:hypothetical protein
MPHFIFNIPLSGQATYKVEADTEEQAAQLLALEAEENGEESGNKYLQESDSGWALQSLNRGCLAEKLEDYCEKD